MDIEETRKGKKEKILRRERERTHGRRRGDSNFDGGEEIQILLYKRENPIFAIR